MDITTREKEFVKEYTALVKKYGVQLSAVAQSKNYGSMIQIEPNLIIANVDGWAPETEDVPEETVTSK